MITRPLLVELFTEELPPKALPKLGQAFAQGLCAALTQQGLIATDNTVVPFATPRRLAVRLTRVLDEAPEQAFSEKLMPVKVGLDSSGAATPALLKKLAAKGLEQMDISQLGRESDGKQDYLVASGTAPGAKLVDVLQTAIETTLAGLPIPKVMKYQLADGQTSVKFVRPAHALVTLFGEEIIPAQILGLTAGRVTHGHRFLHPGALTITSAESYETQLAQTGHVVASFDARRTQIQALLDAQATRLGASLGRDPEVPALLDEVTALVEAPVVYVGTFEERFLAVPQECLILTMRLNQKYFPLFHPTTGKLTNQFLIVSNMPTDQPVAIIEGNERVIRPRLADAEFFFETDRKVPLAARVDQLSAIVYHNKLGTQLERTARVQKIAAWLAHTLGANVAECERAALLAKADLNTNMVGEFPELQGIMGAYYARGDKESPQVVEALAGQYRIRIDAPVQPENLTATVLFMAERAETLVGIWGIGLAPTGERDPFGLRRAALGLISAFEQLTAGAVLNIQQDGPLTLQGLLQACADTFTPGVLQADTVSEVQAFILERLRNQLITQFDRNAVEAVLAIAPPLHQVPARVVAAEAFAQSPDAASLAAANKRIGNLLKKVEGTLPAVNAALLTEPAEQALAQSIAAVQPVAQKQFDSGDYKAALATLAQTRAAVDTFFNDIMVMADDQAVRLNRLALLAQLHRLMNQVADISRLAT
ncbi:glycine--tRNA ligase subunit beta [Zwartia panacis]|uniref:glycine--tRNA ligase subunit beta n=1 Tax=Zwartia panacis TaxID=2683345 RepID=UPI0025B2D50D|nr:glycine--tRNA ligase subunit beta [Zwartia panacis]MDN4015388.1 glycine--tRNA ligase subunit beta [Zwartia panacis]